MSYAATSTAPFGFGPLTQDAPPAEVALVSRLLDLARAAEDCSGRIHQAVLLVGAAMRRWARLALASEVTGPARPRRPAAAVPCRFPWRAAAARRHCRWLTRVARGGGDAPADRGAG